MVVGICAIIKDCKPNNLIEWVEWHKLIGFDYIFIYDNESQIPITETLKGYDYVFIEQIKGEKKQIYSYNKCINDQKKKTKNKCNWIAFIDDDEFIVVESGNIKDLLSKQKSAGLGLNWIMFGGVDNSFINEKQIFKYRKHSFDNEKANKHIKSIVQPEKVNKFLTPHHCLFERRESCVDVYGKKINGAFVNKPTHEIAWINHYFCKSEKEFKEKIKRGRAASPKSLNFQYYNEINDKCIYTTDKIINIFNNLMK